MTADAAQGPEGTAQGETADMSAPMRVAGAAAAAAVVEPAGGHRVVTDELRVMFSRLHIESTAGGGLRIEAPAEAAAALAAVFEGLAGLLGGSTELTAANAPTARGESRRGSS